MKTISCISLISSLILLTGCHVSSKVAVGGSGGRTAYNETLQKTTNEQMLLNLVRLRYVDFPFFLDVNAITTQFSFGQKVQPVIPIIPSEKNPAKLGGEISWSNTPTISYTPLQGQTFALQLFKPIDLVIIQQLIYTGWDIERVFKLCIQSIDDLPNASAASGPVPEYQPEYKRFNQLTTLLRYFQQRSQLQVSVKLNPENKYFTGSGLGISFPADNEKAKEVAALMKGGSREGKHYVYNIGIGFNENKNIGIMPRSLMACMYYLSLGVNIPKCSQEALCVPYTQHASGDVFDWREVIGDLLTVQNSKSKPTSAFVSVKYRDYWFYIHEHDLQSKRTFVLLLQLYNLQSNSATPNAPLLTLPLG